MRNSGWSGDRMPRNRIMLIAVPLIVTMAVGLIVGIRLVSEKNATLRLSNTGQGTANSTPAAPAPAASPSVTPSPTVAATPATAATPGAATPTTAATNMSWLLRPANPRRAPWLATPVQLAAARVLVDGAGAAAAAAGDVTQQDTAGGAGMPGAASPAAARALRQNQSRTPGAATAPMGA